MQGAYSVEQRMTRPAWIRLNCDVADFHHAIQGELCADVQMLEIAGFAEAQRMRAGWGPHRDLVHAERLAHWLCEG